tara:strand:+ start:224 stop:787 length:564 start_codon:yes stop_codon:yes gene_type:complete
MKRIAIFASGNGTNAKNICKYFENSTKISISLICTNNSKANVLKKLSCYNLKYLIFTKRDMNNLSLIEDTLEELSIDLIILAGFLLKIPTKIINKYNNKIINVHPSLLPKYGGKGMYGSNVHKAVLLNKETKTGVTFHFVSEEYDKGQIILQKSFLIKQGDSVKSLQKRVQSLEHKYFPLVIKKVLL